MYRCVPMESNVCLRDNICLSGTSVFISHFLFSPCISVVKAWARASGFNSASMNAQKHVPHPQKEVQSSVLLTREKMHLHKPTCQNCSTLLGMIRRKTNRGFPTQ